MADDQDRTTPLPGAPESQQPASGDQDPAASASTPQVETQPQSQQSLDPVQPQQPVPTEPFPQTPPYGQPPQPPAAGQPANPHGQQAPVDYLQPQKSGKATAALVCGIIAILLAWMILPSIILGVVAIVLAVKAVKEAGKDGKAIGGKVCGIIGIVLSVLSLILYLVIGLGAVAFVANHADIASIAENPSAISTPGSAVEATEDMKQLEAAAKEELDKLKNKDAAFVQKLASELDQEFVNESGYSLAELGVDATAFAQWMLTDFDYTLDGASLRTESSGSAFADVTLRDAYAFASTFAADAQAYIDALEPGSVDEATAKAKLGELFNAAMDKTTATHEDYVSLEYQKVGGVWTIDQEAWSSELDFLFGID